jgi:hypothetical protein
MQSGQTELEARVNLGEAAGEACALVQRAVRERRPILARCRRDLILVCPHALGRRGGDWYVLTFGYFDTSPGTFTSGSWRWLRVADLSRVEIKGDFWLSAPPASRPSLRFLDEVVAEVEAR